MKFKIAAPTEFNGEVGGVQFRDGVAEVEASHPALAYFRRRGYKVEPASEPKRATSRAKKTDE